METASVVDAGSPSLARCVGVQDGHFFEENHAVATSQRAGTPTINRDGLADILVVYSHIMNNDHTLRVYKSILGLLSNEDNPTPLVQLNKVVPYQHTRVFAKLEWFNPFGAVKDRVADNLIRDAENGVC